MDQPNSAHPDTVLQALLDKNPRSHKAANLRSLHSLCEKQYAIRNPALRDFSLASVGRQCEANGIFKARVLYNASSQDYVTLIRAWAAFNGSVGTKAREKDVKLSGKYDFLTRIDDLALRGIVQSIIAERDKLRNQVNILKSQSNLVIDQRTLGATIAQSVGNVAILEMSAQLTSSERSALQNAISEDFLNDRDWRLGANGEIFTKTGAVVYDPGYTTAIRKILGKK